MDKEFKKAIAKAAQALALSNAAEFIRSHSETGHSFEDSDLQSAYEKEIKRLSEQLTKRADKAFKDFENYGYNINMDTI